MPYYLSTPTIIAAYRELASVSLSSPGILHIFLILKAAGFNSRTLEPISNIMEKGFLPAYKISGLFTPEEKIPDSYEFISPFKMREWEGQSISEPLKKWVSLRIKNNILGGATTWRSIIADDPNGTSVKFKHDYLNAIASEHLGQQKIPLVALAVWANRFTSFDNRRSTGEIIDLFISEFKITKQELASLFSSRTDIQITYDEHLYNGSIIRELIGKPPKNPPANWINFTPNNNFQRQDYPFVIENFKPFFLGKRTMNADKVYDLLKESHQVILSGPPGTSKSYIANEIAKKYFNGNVTKVQFHPKYSYQDFIGGYVVRGQDVTFERGILINLIEKVIPKGENQLLIIDEINRTNVGQVFGETIQLLDRDSSTQIRIDGALQEFHLPDNLYIIATMNSSDRSLGAVDFAIRRRFSFAYCPPDAMLLTDNCVSNFSFSISDFLRKINSKLLEVLKNPELAIGHTFFMSSPKVKSGKSIWDAKDLSNLFNHKILPMVEEFCHGNQSQLLAILGNDLPKRLEPDEFIPAVENFIND